jgi:hypothetical protein
MTVFRHFLSNSAAYKHFGTTVANKKVRFTRTRTPKTQATDDTLPFLSVRYSQSP